MEARLALLHPILYTKRLFASGAIEKQHDIFFPAFKFFYFKFFINRMDRIVTHWAFLRDVAFKFCTKLLNQYFLNFVFHNFYPQYVFVYYTTSVMYKSITK